MGYGGILSCSSWRYPILLEMEVFHPPRDGGIPRAHRIGVFHPPRDGGGIHYCNRMLSFSLSGWGYFHPSPSGLGGLRGRHTPGCSRRRREKGKVGISLRFAFLASSLSKASFLKWLRRCPLCFGRLSALKTMCRYRFSPTFGWVL